MAPAQAISCGERSSLEQCQLHRRRDELTQGDLNMALKQMGNYSFTLDRGVAAAKIDATDAAALQAGAEGVVSCIQQIQ